MVDYRMKAKPIEIVVDPTLKQAIAIDLRRLGNWIWDRIARTLRLKNR